MIAKLVLALCLALTSLVDAIPIDAYSYGHGPAITYAAPKILAAPALATTSYVSHAPLVAHAAPAVTYAAAAPITTYAHAAPAVIAHAAPAIVKAAPIAVAEPYDPNPQYSFAYGVTDHHTGDSKSQQESLVNGVVHGSYELAEPDGSIRKVTYTADKINGFNAIVEKKGVAVVAKPAVAVAAVPALPVAKLAYAAPAYAHAPAFAYGHH